MAREGKLDLSELITPFDFAIQAIPQKDSISSVSALLGAGLSGYYEGLIDRIKWDYQGRKVATPFTAMLNFCDRLLEQEIAGCLAGAGLISKYGLWHSGPDALAKDLTTSIKPLSDAIVIRCINRRQITINDFVGWQPQLKSVPMWVCQTLQDDFEQKLNGRGIDGGSFLDAIARLTTDLAKYVGGSRDEFFGLEWR